MFETAVAVGLYHKSDNTIDINPEETTVFAADDQIVALSTSGEPSLPSFLTVRIAAFSLSRKISSWYFGPFAQPPCAM